MFHESPRLDSTINFITTSAEKLKTLNTDKPIFEDFINEINTHITSLSSFQQVAAKVTQSLDYVMQQLVAVYDLMQKTLAKSELHADIV